MSKPRRWTWRFFKYDGWQTREPDIDLPNEIEMVEAAAYDALSVENEKLRNCLLGYKALLDDEVLVRNTDDDADMKKFMQQSTRLMAHFSACREALAAIERGEK